MAEVELSALAGPAIENDVDAVVIGAGFALMIPPIGLTLMARGVILAIWGGIAGWWTTRGDNVPDANQRR